jgi:hypothetical protein
MVVTMHFLTSSQKAATFKWQDIVTLEQISKIKSYSVEHLVLFRNLNTVDL